MEDRVVNFLPFHLDVFILLFIRWNMEIQVCSMMPCSVVNNCRCLEGTVMFWNVRNSSPVNML